MSESASVSESFSTSASISESCCLLDLCACEKWLEEFCDYETVTLDYCGVETEFLFARSSGIKMSSTNPQQGVHPADKVFRLSNLENSVEVGIGGTITDSDGTAWVIYSSRYLTSFCVWVLHARSVSACFSLLDDIDVLELDCMDCDACDYEVRTKRLKRIKGSIIASSGSIQNRNDSRDLVWNFTASLERWPFTVRPSANHRLKNRSGTYRITRVTDNGLFSPYFLGLEAENVQCHVR